MKKNDKLFKQKTKINQAGKKKIKENFSNGMYPALILCISIMLCVVLIPNKILPIEILAWKNIFYVITPLAVLIFIMSLINDIKQRLKQKHEVKNE